jgi:hypothetical protein
MLRLYCIFSHSEVIYFSQDSMGISNTHVRICHVLFGDLPERKIGDLQKWQWKVKPQIQLAVARS